MERAMRGIREVETDSFENYRQKYPEDQPLSTYKHILENIVKTIPNKTAFIQGEREQTWKQFDERTNRIANGLLDLGLKKGDRVAIDGFNSIEWMEAYWGASKAGFVPVNINPRFVADEIKYVLEDSDSVVIFTEDRWVDTIEEVRKDLPLLKEIIVYNAPGYPPTRHPKDPIYKDYEDFMLESSGSKPKLDWEIKNDDFCYLMYTGGTTGWPKGVVYDNWNRAGSMYYGISTELESAWDPIIRGILNDKNFMRGAGDLVANMKLPVISPLLSRIANMLADILFERKRLRDILYPILASDVIKRLVFQYTLPHIIGPIAYSLLGGRINLLIANPLMHGKGYECNFIITCPLGATTIYLEPAQPFDAKILWETVEGRKANIVGIVGDAYMIPMVEELERAKKEGKPYDTSSVIMLPSSGVRLSAELKKRFLSHVPTCMIMDVYGTTEFGGAFTSPAFSIDKEISEHTTYMRRGHGYSAESLLLDLDTGKPAKPGCKHAQFVFGTYLGLGYWKAPSKTKKDFIDINGKRWFLVGDEGYVDEKGGFHLLGRGGGYVINSGGEKVYSEEVEEKIRTHPKVRDVGVVGIPNEKWGEAVTAIVELKEGEKATEDEIKEYLRGKLAAYKIPKNIVFHQVLRTDVGKLMRTEMIELVKQEMEK